MQRASVFGSAGYLGGELLRIILGHPGLELAHAVSASHAGRPLADVHRNLLGTTDATFSDAAPAAVFSGSDVVFLAWEPGRAQRVLVETFGAEPSSYPEAGPRIVDLSGDFRIADHAVYERAYGRAQEAPAWQSAFCYGLTDLERDRVRAARFIANPGCFATAALLAAGPLARAGLVASPIVVSGVTGSSGSGASAKPGTHHPTRAAAFRAYKPLVHQHEPEVARELRALGAPEATDLVFLTHSAPLVRGIHVTVTTRIEAARTREELVALYRETFAASPFVRLRDEPPDVSPLAGTNFCDLAVFARAEGTGTRVVVAAAIDNLVKGGSGQAVQNANVMLGLDERAGLGFVGLHP